MALNQISYASKSVDLPKQVRRQNRALVIAFILIILYPAGLDWYKNRDKPIVSSVTIDNLQLLSPNILCPGDKLIFSYDLHFEGSGVLIRDLTVWNIDPPKTIIFSEARRFILPDSIDQGSLVEAWRIPKFYHSFETDEIQAIPPGNYRRQIAISSTTNEEVVSVNWVEFTIKESTQCPSGRSS